MTCVEYHVVGRRLTAWVPAGITELTLELRQEKGTTMGCSARAQLQRAWKSGNKRIKTGEVRQGARLYHSGSAQCSVGVSEEQRETGHQSYHACKCGVWR